MRKKFCPPKRALVPLCDDRYNAVAIFIFFPLNKLYHFDFYRYSPTNSKFKFRTFEMFLKDLCNFHFARVEELNMKKLKN